MSGKVYVVERFSVDTPVGQVASQSFGDGIERNTIDKEGVIGIDHNALRIQPLMQPGWGRAGITYGPFKRESGLAFGIHVLNGHNTSQTGHLLQSVQRRFVRWIAGSRVENPASRILKFLWNGDKRRQWKQVRRWVRTNRQFSNGSGSTLDENFAAGWFGVSVPANPVAKGNAFVMHAAGPENGELWASVGDHSLQIARGIQNLPIYYVVILREQGAAYYATSLPGAYGLGSFPKMRPVAIDPFNTEQKLYAAAWQSVLGQIGFWVDTRIYGTRVSQLDEYRHWYGTAQAADQLKGQGDLDGTLTETGDRWNVVRGKISRTKEGAHSEAQESVAVLELVSSAGLIHLHLEGSDEGGIGLVWRWRDERNYWQILAASSDCRLYCCQDGIISEIAVDSNTGTVAGQRHSMQLVENGTTFNVYLDGKLVFGRWFSDERLAGNNMAGICYSGASSQDYLIAFEAHPTEVPLPETLDFDSPWFPEEGRQLVIQDDFFGSAGELSGRITPNGGRDWRRVLGRGRFLTLSDGGMRVQATVEKPNPGRTAYTVPWYEPDFSDVRVRITPPGESRGEYHLGRGGIVFWQDQQNYLIINTWIDDVYEGASLSSFFYIQGYEDVFDAVWTNVGTRITWGQPYNLRATFDGINYLVTLNNEPVLYRALTDVYPSCQPLSINGVGLVANWEWGNDTGTRFDNFQVFGTEK